MRAPVLHEVAQALCATPGFLSRDYARIVRVERATVGRVIQRLRAHGYVRGDKIAGQRGGIVRWYPTPALKKLIAAGQLPTLPRDPAPEDDDWTPPAWVHPIRARALGLSRSA